jgi:FdhD protein
MYIEEKYIRRACHMACPNKLELIRYEKAREILRDGSVRENEFAIPVEHSVTVCVNGREVMEISCTGQYLAEVILGRLLTAGIIEDAGEVESVCVSESGEVGEVILREPKGQWNTECRLSPVEPVMWEKEWVFALADRLADGMPLHQETFAVHSCFLSMRGKLLFACEDIGRHNAFDKVIGYALRNQIDLRQCIVYSSGRIPVDMAVKAIRAGIPVLAAKAVPTCEAVRLAGKYGLTLVCSARRDMMRVCVS